MSSQTLITDMKTAIATGPNAVSLANANAASGQIMDLTGNLNLVLLKLQEAKVLLNAILVNDLQAQDPTYTGLNGVLGSLS